LPVASRDALERWMLSKQVESMFKHGRPLSSVTHVNTEAQAENKPCSSSGDVERSNEFLHNIPRYPH